MYENVFKVGLMKVKYDLCQIKKCVGVQAETFLMIQLMLFQNIVINNVKKMCVLEIYYILHCWNYHWWTSGTFNLILFLKSTPQSYNWAYKTISDCSPNQHKFNLNPLILTFCLHVPLKHLLPPCKNPSN